MVRGLGFSQTLPRNFVFHGLDAEPRTPRQEEGEPKTPPAPRHSSCRIRRPRVSLLSHSGTMADLFSADIPLPSIELSSDTSTPAPISSDPPERKHPGRLQVPSRELLEPKTPPAQIRESALDNVSSWPFRPEPDNDFTEQRPSSSCSDSSVSSLQSYTTQTSIGGSCTSPESDTQDPSLAYFGAKKDVLDTPSKPEKTSQVQKKNVRVRPIVWTPEMDAHLWDTYNDFLQNPTSAPFKMLPGTLPPLGVSHRVARLARKSWPKVTIPRRAVGNTKNKQRSNESPQSGSTTPKSSVVPVKLAWPTSDSATRRRLKELCKRKTSLSVHYRRLIRSPSPAGPSSDELTSESPRKDTAGNPTFATRDLGVSLVASSVSQDTAKKIHGNMTAVPLSDKSTGDVTPRANTRHAKLPSASLDFGIPTNGPRLGSPFIYKTWGPSQSSYMLRTSTPKHQRPTIHVTGSRLRSPIQSDNDPVPAKRRAVPHRDDEHTPVANNLAQLFADNSQARWNGSRVRVRTRGATVSGSTGSGTRIDQLFTPPSAVSSASNNSNTKKNSPKLPSGSLVVPNREDIKRLGSPFHSDLQFHPAVSNPFTSSGSKTLSALDAQSRGSSSTAPRRKTLASDFPFKTPSRDFNPSS